MKKKILCYWLFIVLLFSSSCQKKQVAQTTVENPINQVQENQIGKSISPETEPETVEDEKSSLKDIPFSSPDLSLSYKKNFIKNEDEGMQRKNYFFIPLQIRNNQFEYCIDQNLVRFDLKTKTEKVYEDVFKDLSITAPLYLPGEWIVVDKNLYYFIVNLEEEDKESRYMVCKDAATLTTIWKTKLFSDGPSDFMNNKLMHDDQFLFVGFNENYKAYCVEMATGKLVWEFDPFTVFTMLSSKLKYQDMASYRSQNLYAKHTFQGGVVFEIGADVDKSKDPLNVHGDSMTKSFVLSTSGKLINTLDSEAIIFLHDLYLYEDGCKSVIDNKIQWNGIAKFSRNSEMSFHKRNNVAINPYLYTSNGKMFYIQDGGINSTITVFDNLSGSVIWKKQYQDIKLVTVFEMESKYYVFYKENNNGFLLIHDIKSSKEKIIPISLNKDNPHFYVDYSTFKVGNQDHLFFSDSLLSFNEEKGLYQSLFSKKELDDYYIQHDFGNWREPFFFSSSNFFVIAYNPTEDDRRVSRGGGFIVLEKK